MDFFGTNDLFFHNCKHPTFSSHQGESHIDLTITNRAANGTIHGWQALLYETMSDHRYITFSIKLNSTRPINNTLHCNRYNLIRANWESFDTDFITGINEISDMIIYKYPVNHITNRFTNRIINCSNKNTPKEKVFLLCALVE